MKLLIPGPVTTHASVRAALAVDYAPWDEEFGRIYASVRARLLAIAGGNPDRHAVLPLAGSGHFAIEAAIRSFVPRGGTLLLPMTGSYADRLRRLAEEAGRIVVPLPVGDRCGADPDAVEAALAADPRIGHLALVYSETGSGLIHDVPALAARAGRQGRRVLVDAVSAFGALPLDIDHLDAIDAVVFTANKALESVPGMSFTIAPIARLRASRGQAESWSLDLADIHHHSERTGLGWPRFTPAAQVVAALDVALDRYAAEGRVARLARYEANMKTLYRGLSALGLTPCLPLDRQGPIVVNIAAPDDPAWSLGQFVERLKARGFLISNFYNTPAPSFRIGCIGDITPDDMAMAVRAIDQVLGELGVQTRAGTPS